MREPKQVPRAEHLTSVVKLCQISAEKDEMVLNITALQSCRVEETLFLLVKLTETKSLYASKLILNFPFLKNM